MGKFRPEKTSVEQMARALHGSDTSTSVSLSSDHDLDKLLEVEKASKLNRAQDELTEKLEKHIDYLQNIGTELAKDMNNIEISPLGSYALISPFKQNPFNKFKVRSSGIIEVTGLAPTFKSNETGEIEEETEFIKTGVVVETGPECKFLKTGDIVFYNLPSSVDVPFYNFGFVIVNEQRILAVVNEGLSGRKDK